MNDLWNRFSIIFLVILWAKRAHTLVIPIANDVRMLLCSTMSGKVVLAMFYIGLKLNGSECHKQILLISHRLRTHVCLFANNFWRWSGQTSALNLAVIVMSRNICHICVWLSASSQGVWYENSCLTFSPKKRRNIYTGFYWICLISSDWTKFWYIICFGIYQMNDLPTQTISATWRLYWKFL